jgi:hypothetical protein
MIQTRFANSFLLHFSSFIGFYTKFDMLIKLLVFRMDKLHEAANMASLIDGYCSLHSKQANSSIWIKLPPSKPPLDNRKSPLKVSSRAQSLTSDETDTNAHKNPSRSSGSGSELKKNRKYYIFKGIIY